MTIRFQKQVCECGDHIGVNNMPQHKRSMRHRLIMAKQQDHGVTGAELVASIFARGSTAAGPFIEKKEETNENE